MKEERREEIRRRAQEPAHFVSTRNACKLCAPLGASVVFRGIESCIPLVHGSQGCSTYIRRYIISHFKEPIDIASSNFNETSAIFGGGDNLMTALDNIDRQYLPEAIGIATTCLSETIGDDVRLYLDQYRKSRKDKTLPALIHASTPSYRGTHMEGFQAAVTATVRSLAGPVTGHDAVNFIPLFLSSEDLRLFKEILTGFGLPYTMLPDYSETLDGESWSDYEKLPAGGTPIGSIRAMAGAPATIQLGRSLRGLAGAAAFLEEKFGVKAFFPGIPLGIRETDRFMDILGELSGRPLPEKYAGERGRLVDAYIDGHKYVFGKRAVIYGEVDFVAALASFLDEIGMVPALLATGASTGRLEEVVRSVTTNSPEAPLIVEGTDFASIHDLCRKVGADIMIGNSKGYSVARKLGIPLVRAGFPIHDRLGGQRILHVGYRGTQQLFDRTVNALIESRQNSSPVGYSYI